MSNRKRVTALENNINKRTSDWLVFVLPSKILDDSYICDKIVLKANGYASTDSREPIGTVVLLPDNHRAPPDQKLNKIIKDVLIEEKREDLLQYIRRE